MRFAACAGVLILLAIANERSPMLSAAETITNTIGMKLVSISAGSFMMGAEEEHSQTLNDFPYCNPAWLDGELPRHEVHITKPFYMGQYEVTFGQFLKFYYDANYKTDMERDGKPSWGYSQDRQPVESTHWRFWAPGWEITYDHPVVFVSWNDAVAFCNWLSKKEGKTYRLPTESEWEYACRAGSNFRYYFGNNPEDLIRYGNVADAVRKNDSAKYGGISVVATFKIEKMTDTHIPYPFVSGSDGYAWTAPVGKFQPNAFGLNDMHGNVWEWCSDRFDVNYYANSPVSDPQGAPAGSSFVVRGGGFDDTPVALRCAYRNFGVDPSWRSYHFGFRVVCE